MKYIKNIKEYLSESNIIKVDNDIIKGRFLDKKGSIDLQKEIEGHYSTEVKFGKDNKDIRTNIFNIETPIAEKEINGIKLSIIEGLIRDDKKTYLLYSDGKLVGEFFSISDIKKIVKYIEEGLIDNKVIESVDYHTLNDGDEYDIVKVTRDNRHEYSIVDGITYELSRSGEDLMVDIDLIEHTEENLFYHDQIERYIQYIQEGGILETFPVNESDLGGVSNLEEILDYLQESENFELLYELTGDKKDNHLWLYDTNDTISLDIEKYGIDSGILNKIRNVEDLNLYYGSDYEDGYTEEELEDGEIFWKEEYHNTFKHLLEYWEDNKEYTLTDMNHRFSALKELGVKRVYVDLS